LGRLWFQPGREVESSQDPISTNGWVWWYIPVISALWGSTNRRIMFQASPGIKQDLFQSNQFKTKQPPPKTRAIVVTQPVVLLKKKENEKRIK
jgi:hypothetical protein